MPVSVFTVNKELSSRKYACVTGPRYRNWDRGTGLGTPNQASDAGTGESKDGMAYEKALAEIYVFSAAREMR